MKKLLTIAFFLVCAQTAFSQHYYKHNFNNRTKAATFQVAPTIANYDGVKFGFGIGMNYKQVLSVNYFHTRDYGSSEEQPWMDNRFAGLHLSVAQPVAENIELAVGARKGTLNSEIQKTVFSGEVRYKFSDSWRLAFEYGGNAERKMTSVRLLFNLY